MTGDTSLFNELFACCRGSQPFTAPRPRRTSSGVSAGVGAYYVPHPSDSPDQQWEVSSRVWRMECLCRCQLLRKTACAVATCP